MPDRNIVAPATSIEEYLDTSLLRKSTPIANPKAEIIASASPKPIGPRVDIAVVLTNRTLELVLKSASLSRANINPINARLIPTMWVLCSLSRKNNLANNTMTTISRGPAIRDSFDAPILLIESYHVKIPIASDNDARIRNLQDSAKYAIILIFFLKIKVAANNNNTPAKVMLVEESNKGEI